MTEPLRKLQLVKIGKEFVRYVLEDNVGHVHAQGGRFRGALPAASAGAHAKLVTAYLPDQHFYVISCA